MAIVFIRWSKFLLEILVVFPGKSPWLMIRMRSREQEYQNDLKNQVISKLHLENRNFFRHPESPRIQWINAASFLSVSALAGQEPWQRHLIRRPIPLPPWEYLYLNSAPPTNISDNTTTMNSTAHQILALSLRIRVRSYWPHRLRAVRVVAWPANTVQVSVRRYVLPQQGVSTTPLMVHF